MSRVLIVCPDHVKREMTGPAIRYYELSHQLAAAGHQVTALTRSMSKREDLRALGASVAVADALNREALIAAADFSALLCVRLTHATRAPSRASRIAKAWPISLYR